MLKRKFFYWLTISNFLYIIVLLILAGVSIATLTGQNGILTRANNAKENTAQAKENELRQLTAIEATTYLEEHKYEDPSGKTITIPAQCAVSQVEGENTLEDGLVIIDTNGNEWVWIEVPESVTASATTDDEIKNVLINYVTEYRDNNYSDTWYEGCGLEKQEYENKYSEMLQSIKANGGFYIGKYEVGSFDNPVTSEDTTRTSEDTTRTAVIQKGAYPYNYVTCSQAEELAEKLATEENTSTLLFGIQWDLVLKYLETKGVQQSELKKDSGSWGNYNNAEFSVSEGNKYAIHSNYSLGEWANVPVNYYKPSYSSSGNGILLSAGATVRNIKMNIYDLAGNVFEWTLEKSIDNRYPCVSRGGNCNFSGSDYSVTSRIYYDTTSSSFSDFGFRPALY